MSSFMMRTAAQEASIPVFGWTITHWPPDPPGDKQYASSPAGQLKLAKTDCSAVPDQSLEMNSATPAPTANLAFISGQDASYVPADAHWHIQPSGWINYALSVPTPVDVNINFHLAAPGDHSTEVQVIINGQTVLDNYKIHSGIEHLRVPISSKLLNTDKTNSLQLHTKKEASTHTILAVVEVYSAANTVLALSQWSQINSGYLPNKQDSSTWSQAVTTGVTTTKSESYSFTESIGVEVGGEAGFNWGVYAVKVSAKLSASFSAGQSFEHQIAVSNESTTTLEITVEGSEKGATTFQVWQLEVLFQNEAGDFILQQLDPSIAPLVITQFVA